jgi:hypothetical protein
MGDWFEYIIDPVWARFYLTLFRQVASGGQATSR